MPSTFGGFHDNVGFDFHGAQGSGGVRGKVGIAGASGKNHYPAFFQMTDGAAADKRLGNLVHLNRRLHSGVDALLFERILQCQGIDHCCEHAHMIGGNPVHFFGLLGHAAKKIPSADHDRNLNSQGSHVSQLRGNFVNAKRIDAETLGRGQGLAGKLEQNAFKDGSGHP